LFFKIRIAYRKTPGKPLSIQLSDKELKSIGEDIVKWIEKTDFPDDRIQKTFPILIKIMKARYKGNIAPVLAIPAILAISAIGSEYYKAKQKKYETQSKKNPKKKKTKRKKRK